MIAIGYCVARLIPFYEKYYDDELESIEEHRIWKKDSYRVVHRFGTLKEAISKAEYENLAHDYSTFTVFIIGIDGKYYRPTQWQKYQAVYPNSEYAPDSFLRTFWRKWLKGQKVK